VDPASVGIDPIRREELLRAAGDVQAGKKPGEEPPAGAEGAEKPSEPPPVEPPDEQPIDEKGAVDEDPGATDDPRS
jgi:hypothetical protein